MGIWTKRSIAELSAHNAPETHQLKKNLTIFDLICLGIGAVIGAGLFSVTGIAAAENAGPAIIIAFLVAALGCALAALCYSELASMIPISGSAYTYAYATMGELIAWLTGWNLILEYAIGSAAVAISWSAYFVTLLQQFHIELPAFLVASPWQPVTHSGGAEVYGLINLPALLIVSAISLLLMRGVKQASAVNSIIVAIKVGVALLFIGVGFFYINMENFDPFLPENSGDFGHFGYSGILRAAGTLFFAYIGFDTVSTACQETANPQKNIPIAIISSLAISTVIYILFGATLTGLVNYKELNVAAPVALAMSKTPLTSLSWLIELAVLAGFTSVILVMLLGQSRIFYAMSRDGFLPKWFSTIHPRWHTPWCSNLVLMAFVGLFSAFAPLSLVGHMTSIGTLLAFIIVCSSVIVLRYKEPAASRPFKTPFFPFVPLLGILVCMIMMLSLGIDNWLRLLVWLTIGLAIYFRYSRQHIRDSKETT